MNFPGISAIASSLQDMFYANDLGAGSATERRRRKAHFRMS